MDSMLYDSAWMFEASRNPRGAAARAKAISPARSKNMAKKIVGFVKLQVPAGKANPSPPIGPALGQRV